MDRLLKFIDNEAKLIDTLNGDKEPVVKLYEKAIEYHRLSRVEIITLFNEIKVIGNYLNNDFLKEKGLEMELTEEYTFKKFIHIYANKELKIKFPQTVQELRELFLKYRFDVDVYYKEKDEEKEIDVLFVKEREEDIWEDEKQKGLFEKYSEITLQKAEKEDFNDLLHFVAYHSVHQICNKTKNEMENFRKKQYDNQMGDGKVESWVPIPSELLGGYEDGKVYLCPELIEKEADNLAREFVGDSFENEQIDLTELNKVMRELLYKKVFTHEFGHLVFDWTQAKHREVREKQANYFSSYITDGKLDRFIAAFTCKQPEEYHCPYLKDDKRAQNLYKGTL